MNKTYVFPKTVSSIEGTSTGFTNVIFHLFMNTFDVSHKSTMLSKFFVTIMALVIFELFVNCISEKKNRKIVKKSKIGKLRENTYMCDLSE